MSVSSTGTPFLAHYAQISDDGRYITFIGSTHPGGLTPCDGEPVPPGGCPHFVGGQFIFDREIGQLSYVAKHDLSGSPVRKHVMESNDRGRYYAFASNQPVVASDTNDGWDVYIKDLKRIRRGVGELVPSIGVEGQRTFQRSGMVTLLDPPHDSVVSGVGEIIAARLAQRPELEDLYVRIDVDRMVPDVGFGIAGSPLVYGLRFDVEKKRYEVRASSLMGGTFGLFDCTNPRPLCMKVADLRGGYGTTGMRVVFSLPLAKIGLESGGKLKDVEAFSALGTSHTGAGKILDRLAIK